MVQAGAFPIILRIKFFLYLKQIISSVNNFFLAVNRVSITLQYFTFFGKSKFEIVSVKKLALIICFHSSI